MRQMTRVTVLLTLVTLSLAKTSQPIFIDSYEGQDVNISCNHTTIATGDSIFWYRQFPNQGPQYIIQGYKTNVENEVASLFIPADRKVSTLRLARASLRDSAVYYCIVRMHTETDGAAPAQYPWYPNQGLQLLLKYISGDSLVSGIRGFKAEFKSETTFHLEKPLARWRDSAKYFCLWVTQFLGQRRAEHKLLVNMKLSVTQEIDLGHFQKDRMFYKDT
ncbi:uncharacterized protein LOC122444242 [Cervus canadensis]|uniref:uncharacterized protein LOC122444242 n=1 Tax=Cervus canadensis TaxID=1574408 RepID=UPI001C9E5ABE|nr:uncharacterized protein LOC122444242 [Cervus canadensis]